MIGKGSDTAKAALLVVLIVGFLGFTVFRLMGGKSAPKSEPVTVVSPELNTGNDLKKVAELPKTSSGLADNSTPARQEGSVQPLQNAAPKPEDYSGPIPPAPPDPFKPPAGAKATREAQPGPGTGSVRIAEDTVKGKPLPPVPGAGPGPAMVAAPSAQAIELKGIITGEPSIAVLSVDGQVSYKLQGDRVDGGMKVARITEAGVVLKNAGKNYIIAVGHTLKPEKAIALAEEQLIPRKLPADRVQKAESIEGPYDELLALKAETKRSHRLSVKLASMGGWWKYGAEPTGIPAPSVRTGHAKPTTRISSPVRVRHYRAVPHKRVRRRKHRRTIVRRHGIKHAIASSHGTRRHKHHRHRRHRHHRHHAAAAATPVTPAVVSPPVQ